MILTANNVFSADLDLFWQCHISRLLGANPMKPNQCAVLYRWSIWKNCTVRSFLEPEIWLCQKHDLFSCLSTFRWFWLVFWSCHISGLLRANLMKLQQFAAVYWWTTWENCTVRTFLDSQIWLCKNHDSYRYFLGKQLVLKFMIFAESYLWIKKSSDGAIFPDWSPIEYCSLMLFHRICSKQCWEMTLPKPVKIT